MKHVSEVQDVLRRYVQLAQLLPQTLYGHEKKKQCCRLWELRSQGVCTITVAFVNR